MTAGSMEIFRNVDQDKMNDLRCTAKYHLGLRGLDTRTMSYRDNKGNITFIIAASKRTKTKK